MIAFDGAVLPEEERMLLDVLGRQPGWRVWPSETSVDATHRERDVAVRFSADAAPVLAAPRVPDGYPYALAVFVWNCVRYGPAPWWRGSILNRPDLWRRTALADYLPHWSNLLDWIHLAPGDLLDLARTTFHDLQPGVRTDADATRAAEALQQVVTSARQYTRLSGFLAHLDHPQTEIAQGLLDEGFEIEVFWGPEQMDVWRLTLRRGPVRVGFGIERGISDGIWLAHDGFREREPRDSPPGLSQIWQVWQRRTGRVDLAPDPFAPATSAAYAAVTELAEWLSEATPADLAAVDRLRDAVSALRRLEWTEPRRTAGLEERLEAAERAIAGR